VNEFSRGSFGERVVMTCQVCMNSHHEGRKEVFVQDPKTGAYAKKICPLCMCLDCVQLHDDPIRRQIRPLMMGQTLQSTYNLNVDHHEPGQQPTKRNIHIKAPGPLNVSDAMKAIGDLLGLQAPGQQARHALPQAVGCGCGKNATSRCISCEAPLCMKCLKNHEC
jgi:UDP-N-acetylmuramyl tripeptide synthase